mmetsp:Transcript_2055/g.5506  ORF Transcript_2055/g.5506 Transcript_2055/m.5506 type:complete len:209 (+) Transcript_2055:667-1293(+)
MLARLLVRSSDAERDQSPQTWLHDARHALRAVCEAEHRGAHLFEIAARGAQAYAAFVLGKQRGHVVRARKVRVRVKLQRDDARGIADVIDKNAPQVRAHRVRSVHAQVQKQLQDALLRLRVAAANSHGGRVRGVARGGIGAQRECQARGAPVDVVVGRNARVHQKAACGEDHRVVARADERPHVLQHENVILLHATPLALLLLLWRRR